MAVTTKRLTYEEYLQTPEMMARYEIVDGEMIMMATPTRKHQSLVKRILRLLSDFVESHDLGSVEVSPLDILIHRDPLRTCQPDLLFISKATIESVGEDVLDAMSPLTIAPELVVEILSPTNTRQDVCKKLDDYCRIGVRECWLVSPEAHTVEVLKLSKKGEKRLGIFAVGEKVRSEVLKGLELKVSDIFA